MNSAEIEMKLADIVEAQFNQEAFIFQFMEVFDPPKATMTKLKNAAQENPQPGSDLLWPRKLHFRTAESGQTARVIDTLKFEDIPKSKAPRFVMATDGKEFSLFDKKLDEIRHCDFDKLNEHFDFFLPLAGIERYAGSEERQVDVKAASRVAKLHDEILRINPDWDSAAKNHALNQFLTRILFCLFAEDTGSFEKDLFVKTVTEYGGEDGQHLQSLLQQMFAIMNQPQTERGKQPAHLRAFPWVNGGLFAAKTEIPACSARIRRLLLDAAALDWREISPDIFGSMMQAVANPEMRGELGLHYTSESNIMKVLRPLFLYSLEEDYATAQGHAEERILLQNLLQRIGNIRVFDPACGSGNFLIVAYRELRSLEIRILKRLRDLSASGFILPASVVRLENFYGIEIVDFAAETAKLSLWITEFQMNQRFKTEMGTAPPDFPLKAGGHIYTGNALRLDWAEVCAPLESAETYLVGNPPYQGSTGQSKTQKEDLAQVFTPLTKRFKNLDYVAAWYMKGAQYCANQKAECAFVATNSLCQGDSVGLLWPLIFACGIEISFAHQSFKWKNLAAHNAGVTCIIAGLRQQGAGKKRLFSGEDCRHVNHIGPYLIEMPDIIVHKTTSPLNGLPEMEYGNKPTDGGHLILSPYDKNQLLEHYPNAEPLVRRLYGSQELIKGIERYCLWIRDEDLPLAQSIAPVVGRIEKVREFRNKSAAQSTQEWSVHSHKFRQIQGNINAEHALIIPSVSSDNRPYIPIGLITDGGIITNSAFAVYDAEVYLLAILSSRLHIGWIKAVCGKLETRVRYSNTLGYNTFPIPPLTDEQKQTLEDHAWAIIAAREAHPGKTLARLYDSKTGPANVLAAHQALDDTLEKIYIGRPFKNDTERLEHLFERYTEMTKT